MTDALKVKTSNDAADDTKPTAAGERWQLIAEAAYYRAVNRGFQNGDPVDDWFVAEREIDTLLLSQPARGVKPARKPEFVARSDKPRNTKDAGSHSRR